MYWLLAGYVDLENDENLSFSLIWMHSPLISGRFGALRETLWAGLMDYF